MRKVGVGKLTLGAVLIALGIAFLLQMYTDYPAASKILDYWPLAIVLLGVEFLIVSRNPEVRARVSVPAVLLTGLVFLLALGVQAGGYLFYFSPGAWGPRIALPWNAAPYTIEIPISEELGANLTAVDLSMVGQVKVTGGGERAVKGTIALEVVGPRYEDAKREAEGFDVKVDRVGDTLKIELTREAGFISFSNAKIISTLTVPAELDLTMRTSAGSASVFGVTGNVDLLTSAGSLTIDGSPKAVDATVSAGSLKASLGPEMTSFKARVSAGSMDLLVPDGVGAKVKATASAGSVSSSLHGLSVTKSPGSGRASGTIGSGKCEVDLTVSAGSIRIDGPSGL